MDPLYFRENESKGEDAIVFVHSGGVSGWAWHAALQSQSERNFSPNARCGVKK